MEACPPDTTCYNCVCLKHNFGLPHIVAATTWYWHFEEASSEEEHERMHLARFDVDVASGRLSNPVKPRQFRGLASRWHNNITPSHKRARDTDNAQSFAKQGHQQDFSGENNNEVCICLVIKLTVAHHVQFADPHLDSPAHSPAHSPTHSPACLPTHSPARPPTHFPARSSTHLPARLPSHSPVHSLTHSPDLPVVPLDPPNPLPDSPPIPPLQHQFGINYQWHARPNVDLNALSRSATFQPMHDTIDFIIALRNTSTKDTIAKLSDDALHCLRNPPNTPLLIKSPGIHHSISTYLALEHSSHNAYERVCCSTVRNFLQAPSVDDIQSIYNVEKLICTFTGVEPIHHNMCPNMCLAYTGPLAHLDACSICGKSRWNQQRLQGSDGRVKQVPAQTFTTILLGPQLQARNCSPESPRAMCYLYERTQWILHEFRDTQSISIIDDIAMGWDYLGTILKRDITEHDIVVMVSLDGTQLYSSKESDCWIYIWVILNLSPDQQYKKLHVLPSGFIPGPNKPKNIDSFLFPGFHHLAAIQQEGLSMWDPLTDGRYISNVYLLFTTADGPGLVYWDGMVGHSGKNGCCVYCDTLGW